MKRYAEPQSALQGPELVDDLGLHRDVQRGDRLVEHEHLRLERQRAGDTDALPLPAGELVGVAVGVLGGEAHQVEQLVDPGGSAARGSGRAPAAARR